MTWVHLFSLDSVAIESPVLLFPFLLIWYSSGVQVLERMLACVHATTLSKTQSSPRGYALMLVFAFDRNL